MTYCPSPPIADPATLTGFVRRFVRRFVSGTIRRFVRGTVRGTVASIGRGGIRARVGILRIIDSDDGGVATNSDVGVGRSINRRRLDQEGYPH